MASTPTAHAEVALPRAAWPIRAWRAGAGTVERWTTHRCTSLAASVAFFTAFSLAPTLVIVIAVAGAFLGADAVSGRLYGELGGLLGHDGAVAVQAMVASAWKSDQRLTTTLVSVLGIVIGASATFGELNAALDTIFAVPRDRARTGWRGLLQVRLLSFGLVLGLAFLLVVLLVLDASLRAVLDWAWRGDGTSLAIVQGVRVVTLSGALIAAFTAMLRWLPDVVVPWPYAFRGALVAAVLFSLGRNLFALYLEHAGSAHALGAAGSLAIVLMWLYYSACVFLFGAEVTAHACRRRLEAPGSAMRRPTHPLKA